MFTWRSRRNAVFNGQTQCLAGAATVVRLPSSCDGCPPSGALRQLYWCIAAHPLVDVRASRVLPAPVLLLHALALLLHLRRRHARPSTTRVRWARHPTRPRRRPHRMPPPPGSERPPGRRSGRPPGPPPGPPTPCCCHSRVGSGCLPPSLALRQSPSLHRHSRANVRRHVNRHATRNVAGISSR